MAAVITRMLLVLDTLGDLPPAVLFPLPGLTGPALFEPIIGPAERERMVGHPLHEPLTGKARR